jgi:hypothetical protein
MPDPRKDTSIEDIGLLTLPFKYDGTIVYNRLLAGGSAQVGMAVSLTGLKQVGLGADGARVHGKVVKVEGDGFCSVHVEGGIDLPAAAPIANGSRIVAAGAGLIRAAAAVGAAFAQAAATDQANARGIVTDGSVAASIKVLLRD